ncbi:PREDICTED: pentatricopeptide repeat-containing protein At3g21470-like [Nelumbo nucifera]|uniref:Pentatricopeptide repeat-containing protein n=2 Tax=Nelumbo nucifera TaxID=4432 RepID=A0A822XIY5_NELNU|nr:PREDICTED: pentatricopeptide repeat-containing protein At3g21470-like [Nelumbo nucifera]DAD19962.1 TPA_asm: hypothetical protein HUJ06_021425 [Nelumbo nucifera]
MEDAEALFKQMPEKDASTYTSMMTGFGEHGDVATARRIRNGLDEEALSAFCDMWILGVNPNESTLATVLSVSGRCGFSSTGRGLHSCMVRLGMEIDGYLGSGLIDMYGNCGFIGMAHRNAMIFGFAAHGDGKAALANGNVLRNGNWGSEA